MIRESTKSRTAVVAREAQKRETSKASVESSSFLGSGKLPGIYEMLKSKESSPGWDVSLGSFPCKRRCIQVQK